MPKHVANTRSRYMPIDFLGDLSGPGGNVFAIFGAIQVLGREVYGDPKLLSKFKAELDNRPTAGTYDDVLDLIVEWFGPQSAINTYDRR